MTKTVPACSTMFHLLVVARRGATQGIAANTVTTRGASPLNNRLFNRLCCNKTQQHIAHSRKQSNIRQCAGPHNRYELRQRKKREQKSDDIKPNRLTLIPLHDAPFLITYC